VAHHLKRAAAAPLAAAGEEVRETVAELLGDVERRGEEAVREWSLRLDGWAPDSFLVGADEVAAAAAELPEDLGRHISFAQARVRDHFLGPRHLGQYVELLEQVLGAR